MFGPLPAFLARDMFGQFAVGAPGCYSIDGGRLTTQGFVLHGDTALWSLALNHPAQLVEQVVSDAGLGRGSLPIRRIPGQAACIFGPGYRVYGHWLVDFLPRLYVLQEAGFDPTEIDFVLPWDLPPFASELLRVAGIKPSRIIIHNHDDEQLQFDQIIVPTLLRHGNRLHSRFAIATNFWTSRLSVIDATQSTRRKIFVSRARLASGRSLKNRAALERVAVSRGFELIYPEALNLAEQFTLFRGAEQIAGEYGSALHNTLFSRNNTACVALRGTSHAPGFIQTSLAGAFHQQIGYVFGNTTDHSNTDPFEIDEVDFNLALNALELCSAAQNS